jgi:hypothetical protein
MTPFLQMSLDESGEPKVQVTFILSVATSLNPDSINLEIPDFIFDNMLDSYEDYVDLDSMLSVSRYLVTELYGVMYM